VSKKNSEQNQQLLAQVKAVSFDLDDTLWDCAPAIRHAEATVFDWLASNTPRVVAHRTPESLFEHRAQISAAHPELQADVTELRKTAFRALLREHDYPESLAEDAFSVFYKARSTVELYAGVHELLDALAARYQLAAITNGNADLELIGLAHYFSDIQLASLSVAPKPDPQMFQRVLGRFELPPEALLHVGDNPQTDVGGAHNAGVLATWFNQFDETWPADLPEPHFQVATLAELQQLLT